MTIRILLNAAGIVLLLANPGWAQSATTSTTTTGSFESLSPGNQKIANALFSAQNTTGTNLTPLTKDQIAGLKGAQGWGQAFKTMKSDGLVQSKNLGQVVSGYQHTLHASANGGVGHRGQAPLHASGHSSLSGPGVTGRSHVGMGGAMSGGMSGGMAGGHVSMSSGAGFGGGMGGGMGGGGHGGGGRGR